MHQSFAVLPRPHHQYFIMVSGLWYIKGWGCEVVRVVRWWGIVDPSFSYQCISNALPPITPYP
jgi:hypothetical protein